MSRVGFAGALLAVTAVVPWVSLAQDDTCPNPCVPGQLNDPSTFRGSLANQALERQADQQAEAANQQMQQRLDQNYAAYSPKAGGGGGGGGDLGASVGARLKSKPLLPAANNPLLGRWRQMATKPVDLGILGAFPGVQSIVDGSFGGGCQSVFGKGMVAFTPTQLNWVAPDGHEEILNHVEYHSDGANVIVIPTDSDLPLIFGLPNHDHAVVAFFGCRMEREGATPTQVVSRVAPSPAAAGVGAGAGPGAGTLKLKVGDVVDGRLASPPAGTRIFVTPQDPDANLVKAGFTAPGTPPIEKLFAACNIGHGGDQAECTRGLQAMTASALGVATTDSNGEAETGALPVGRYYLVGFTPFKGHSLMWHLPVDVKAGANSVNLSSQDGSISH